MWRDFLFLVGVKFIRCFRIQQEINEFSLSYIAIDSCLKSNRPRRPLQKPTLTEQKVLDILDRGSISR